MTVGTYDRRRFLGMAGAFPGPTIECRAGREVRMRYRNELPVPTVVHLHGGHTPAESDGYPTDLVLPAGRVWRAHHLYDPAAQLTVGEREYRYPMRQRAATLWYHDHRMDFTGPAVYRGLAGFWLVRDDVEDALPLPRGDRELPLMIADRAFAADGSLDYPFAGYPVGTEVTVHNRLGDGSTSIVMRFRVARRAQDDTAIPARLAEIEPLERGQAVNTRDFSLLSGMVAGRHGWLIGGRPFDPAHPVASHSTPDSRTPSIWCQGKRSS